MKKKYSLSCAALLASLAINAQIIETTILEENFDDQQADQAIILLGEASSSYVTTDYMIGQSTNVFNLGNYGLGGQEPNGLELQLGQSAPGPKDSVSINFEIGANQQNGSVFPEWFNGELMFISDRFEYFQLQQSQSAVEINGHSEFILSGLSSYNDVSGVATRSYSFHESSTAEIFTYSTSFYITATNQTTQNFCEGQDPYFVSECICIDEGQPESPEYQDCISQLSGLLYNFQPDQVGIDNLVATAYQHAGCTDSESLNYDPTASEDDQSCVTPEDLINVFNATITIPEGIDTTENPIRETIISSPLLYCGIDFTRSVDEATIISNELFTPDSIRVTWQIKQGENTFTIEMNHPIQQIGNVLTYLTVYCEASTLSKEEQARNGGFDSMTFGSVFTNQGVVTDIFASSDKNKIGFYPNPVTGNIVTLSENANWTLLTAEGQAVTSGSGNTVSLTNQATGTYILQIGQERSMLVKF